MKVDHTSIGKSSSKNPILNKLAVGVFSLSLFVGALPLAAQNQSSNNTVTAQPLPGYPVDAQAGQNGAQGDSQSSPQAVPQTNAPAPQQPDQAPPPPDAQAPPPPPQGAPQANQYTNIRSPYSRQAAAPAQPAPASLTIPAFTIISVRPTQFISSDKNHVGDTFWATLDQPIVVNGWVVARAGQTVMGRVNSVKKSGHFGKESQLGLELTMVSLVDGQQITIQTQGVKSIGGTTTGTDVATLGATTGVGAAVGAAAGGGSGAAIGAGAGAFAGVVGVLVSHGRPTVVTPETFVSFQLATPITVDTSHSQMAFHPVTPADYRGDQDAYENRPRLRQGYNAAPPPPYVYGYPYDPYFLGYPYYGYGWGYPGPVIGLGFGFGGYGGWGGGWRGGFRR